MDRRKKLAHHLAQAATRNALLQHAARQRGGPRGMGTASSLYATDANGYATDPVSLDRIPRSRAVKVGPHTFNAKTLRALLAHNPRATNPLTRQSFPPAIYAKFSTKQNDRVHGTSPRDFTPDQRRVWRAGDELMQQFRRSRAVRAQGHTLGHFATNAAHAIEAQFGVRITRQGMHVVGIDAGGARAGGVRGKVQYDPNFDELYFTLRDNGQHVATAYL